MAGGIDPIRAYDVLEESVVAAPFLKYKRSAFLDPKPPVAMKLGTVLKDLDLILQLAASLEVSLPAVDANSKIYAAAIAAGFGEADMSKLVETYK
jgi:3-hydroxyisobutyrate dehydrogenase-like beta-hydroxyacid dehydrogenase